MEQSKQDYEKLAAVRYALRRFVRLSEHAASQAGLTPQQHQALLAVEGYPGREEISISELAERLQLEHHSVVGLVNRLEKEALLSRATAVEDKRFVLLRVSEKGKALLGQVSEAQKEQLQRAGPELMQALRDFSEGHGQ